MTVGFQITDGTTTLDLNDGTYFEVETLDLGYGGVSAESVEGSVTLYMDTTKANIQTEITALEKLLQQAIDYSGFGEGGALVTSLDKPVYFNYRTDGTESYYRTLILRLNYRIVDSSIEALNNGCPGFEYIVDFERANWWEGPEAQLSLSTALETATTNAVTVYNPEGTDDEHTYCDYVDIAALAVAQIALEESCRKR